MPTPSMHTKRWTIASLSRLIHENKVLRQDRDLWKTKYEQLESLIRECLQQMDRVKLSVRDASPNDFQNDAPVPA